jgi:hypothetical protein
MMSSISGKTHNEVAASPDRHSPRIRYSAWETERHRRLLEIWFGAANQPAAHSGRIFFKSVPGLKPRAQSLNPRPQRFA